MEILQAVVLGVVQGITEFLPISSDGHLILVPSLLGWSRFGLGFDVILHMGTLLATIAYFRKDVAEMAMALVTRGETLASQRMLAWMVIGATVPSVFVVLVLERFIDSVEFRPVSEQIAISAIGLLITAAVLGASEIIAWLEVRSRVRRGLPSSEEDASKMTSGKALVVGFAQGFAALPGVSRSGMTIASGQAMGLSRSESAHFSFLLSIPIIAAATGKKLLDMLLGDGVLPPLLVTVVALVVTATVGYAVIGLLLPFVRKHTLWWFAAYTAIAGILLLVTYGL